MSQRNRIQSGGIVRHDHKLKFTFDGMRLEGLEGDTLASALLANNVMLVGRSYKYHRPRGVLTAGVEEPNAIVAVGAGAGMDSNTRATLAELYDGMEVRSQGGWPSLKYDLAAGLSLFSGMLAAGFYYKTFMWPPSLWMKYEHLIRKAAASAECPSHEDPARYSTRHDHCDVLVVGAGPSGLAAAQTAARAGARVMLVDDQPQPGGSLLHDPEAEIDSMPCTDWVNGVAADLAGMDNVVHLQRTMAVGHYDHNYVVALQSFPPQAGGALPPSGLRHRLRRIRARQVVIATGAIERPLLFGNNDLPGVMMADALEKYIVRYAVLPGKQIVLYLNNDSAYRCAVTAAEAGAKVVVVDPRAGNAEKGWPEAARGHSGVEIRNGHALLKAHGRRRVGMATIAPVDDADGHRVRVDEESKIVCDLVAVAGGWTPTAHLFSQSGGKLAFDDDLGAFVPLEPGLLCPAHCAGAAAGILTLGKCIAQGMSAAGKAVQAIGREKPSAKHPKVRQTEDGSYAAAHFDIRMDSDNGDNGEQANGGQGGIMGRIASLFGYGHASPHGGKVFVDYMNDVTREDILLAEREGYESAEHMKRYTAASFGSDQGKTGNVNALRILADARGAAPQEVGHTTFRPMFAPIPFGAIAGKRRGDLYLPRRKTPLHAWHERNGAVYEHVGDWLRPRYFTTSGESMDEAVRRECLAVREGVGMLDAGTLGKIDIQGPDAGGFLDMVYTNLFSTLREGYGRYGVMLDENGMIFDDGVTFRIGDNRYHMTTTTGGAARVLGWLEGWLQTEWPHMKVWCTSATEQWTVIAVAGPRARHLLAELTDQPLDNESFPFMTFRECKVAGVPCRVFRISFTGEVAFEINVPASHGLHVWEQLVQFGGAHNLTPYGTEAMHVLRAEKGFIIVGQDTDGTLTPSDMGLDWLVSKKKKDFLGKRAQSRPDTSRPDRRQLVGLLTEDPERTIPEGAHLVASSVRTIPARMLGNVTSSYMSPTLRRSIALAPIKGGRGLVGQNVFAADEAAGEMISAKVVEPVFYDQEKEKLHG